MMKDDNQSDVSEMYKVGESNDFKFDDDEVI